MIRMSCWFQRYWDNIFFSWVNSNHWFIWRMSSHLNRLNMAWGQREIGFRRLGGSLSGKEKSPSLKLAIELWSGLKEERNLGGTNHSTLSLLRSKFSRNVWKSLSSVSQARGIDFISCLAVCTIINNSCRRSFQRCTTELRKKMPLREVAWHKSNWCTPAVQVGFKLVVGRHGKPVTHGGTKLRGNLNKGAVSHVPQR